MVSSEDVRLRARHSFIVALIPVVLLFGCTKSPTAPTASNCTFTLSATTVSVGAAGGPTSLTVTTGNACVWTGLTGSSFITMTSAAGITGSGNLTFTVAANTGAARTGTVTAGGQTVTINQAAGTPPPAPPAANDAILGNWAGTITMTVGCVPNLPLTYTWTGVIRVGGATGTELLITVPNTPISGQVFPVTLVNNSISFTVPFDSLYTFTGTVGTDRRSIPTGSFTGTNCRPTGAAINPSGTWTGIHQ